METGFLRFRNRLGSSPADLTDTVNAAAVWEVGTIGPGAICDGWLRVRIGAFKRAFEEPPVHRREILLFAS